MVNLPKFSTNQSLVSPMTDPYVCHFCGNIYRQQKPPIVSIGSINLPDIRNVWVSIQQQWVGGSCVLRWLIFVHFFSQDMVDTPTIGDRLSITPTCIHSRYHSAIPQNIVGCTCTDCDEEICRLWEGFSWYPVRNREWLALRRREPLQVFAEKVQWLFAAGKRHVERCIYISLIQT